MHAGRIGDLPFFNLLGVELAKLSVQFQSIFGSRQQRMLVFAHFINGSLEFFLDALLRLGKGLLVSVELTGIATTNQDVLPFLHLGFELDIRC